MGNYLDTGTPGATAAIDAVGVPYPDETHDLMYGCRCSFVWSNRSLKYDNDPTTTETLVALVS
jgi:hypothetical protein